jgi:cytochrome c556
MSRRYLSASILLGSLVMLGTAGCAMMGSRPMMGSHPTVGSGDLIADRQRLMKLNGASWQDTQNKFKAGQIEAIAVNAETMAINGRHIIALFPKGSLSDKSKAKPEIWQKWPEFDAAAQNMVSWSERLREAARAKDAQGVETIMKDFGRQACGACHTPFRVPPPRQG